MQYPNKKQSGEQVIRVGLYPRVSTDEQVLHGHSLAAQEELLVSYAKANNLKVVKVYRDEGNSARKPILKRKVVLELLEDVKEGKLDRILFIKLDRWTRNVREFHAVQSILDRYNVTWQAILEDYNTITADGRLKLNIMLSVAENEADRTSERVKFTWHSRVQRKEAPFASRVCPFGYHVQIIDGVRRMVKNPETQEIVEYFFKLATYKSVRYAGEMTNKKYGLTRAYSKWHNMITTTAYYGTFHGVEDYCEPYITKEEFDRLNDNPQQVRKTAKNRTYIFSGLLRCGHCNNRMSGKVNRYKPTGKEHHHYRCMGSIIGACKNTTFSEMKIEKYLLENVRKKMEDVILEYEVSMDIPKVKKKKNDVAKLQEKLRRINVSFHAGNMADEEYIAAAAEVREEILKAQQEEQEAEPTLDVEALQEFLNSGFESVYESLNKEERQRLWRSIIDYIEITDGKVTDIKFRA